MIRLDHVTAGYGDGPVLKDVSVHFPKGFTAVIGPNGSGKSTLVKTAMGLVPAQSGQIFYGETPLEDIPLKVRAAKAGILFQDHPKPALTVKQLTAHGRYSQDSWPRRKPDTGRIEAAMKKAGIQNLEHRPVSELSGGQRQKAYLALLLCQDPATYFFDEPNTGLDLASQLKMEELMKELACSHPVIVIMHDLNLALKADHLIVLDQGHCVFEGKPQDFLQTDLLERIFEVKAHPVTVQGKTEYFFRTEKGQIELFRSKEETKVEERCLE